MWLSIPVGWFAYIFLILLILIAGILFGISVFSVSSPRAFCDWFTPLRWIGKRLQPKNPRRYDHFMSYVMGGLMTLGLILIQFVIGGFFATLYFQLWYSPYAFLLITR